MRHSHSQRQPGAEPAKTEELAVRERRPFRQTGRIQHAKLFGLLTAFQLRGHLCLVPFLEKIVVKTKRSLIVPSQRFEFLLDHWAQLHPALKYPNLPLKLLLLLRFLADAHLYLMELRA